MAIARHQIVDNNVVGIYHCHARCVRRAFLCGCDPYTQKDYNHRKAWTFNRVKLLSQIFCIDILTLAVMSNHYHLVVRNRPDRAASLSDWEVAERWNRIHPIRKGPTLANDPSGTVKERIRALVADPQAITSIRSRLHDLSSFMAHINEKIARMANAEDEVTGRFWEGRFKCQKITDNGALLAVMAYVDLNPVRAAMAETLAESTFTGIRERIMAEQARNRLANLPFMESPAPAQKKVIEATRRLSRKDEWLIPFEGSENPFTNLSLRDYLQLVETTGQIICGKKRGALPQNSLAVLQQLDLDTESWVKNIQCLGGLFYRVMGKVQALQSFAKERGRAWFCGKTGSCQLYLQPVKVRMDSPL